MFLSTALSLLAGFGVCAALAFVLDTVATACFHAGEAAEPKPAEGTEL